MEKNEERYWEPELHRLRGELLNRGGAEAGDVEVCFNRAIAIARQQESKSLELRAVMSWSKLLLARGDRDGARDRLSEILHWFTEGFDTPELREAKALLEALV